MRNEVLPNWVKNMEIEDFTFIKKLIIASGSLKDLAKEYEISYPTIRNRLNRLIEKVSLYDSDETDKYIERIKDLAIENKIDLNTAKVLISEYRKVKS